MVCAVILAAGQAKRMGSPKQLLPLGGKPMVWQVATVACQAELLEVVAITGANGAAVGQALAGLPLRIIHNENWQDGQASGIQLAVESLDAKAKAVLFMLADQPLVDKLLVDRLVQTYQRTGASLVVPRWQNQRGNPVLFDLTRWRSELVQLTGDQGARGILKAHHRCIHYVDVLSPEVFYDVDTPEEYQQIEKLWQQRASHLRKKFYSS